MIGKRINFPWLAVAMLAITSLLPLTGCLSGGFALPGQREAALKKKVEADKFPSAQQAGIAGPMK